MVSSVTADIKHLRLDEVMLAYSVHGEGKKGPPIVFVHGYMGRATGKPYEALLNLLARDRPVYAVDMRGHGGSAGAMTEWSLNALADDVVAFTKAIGLNKPVFAGHSLGAFVGLLAEMRHRGTFASLCLLAPAAAKGWEETPPEMVQLLLEHGQDKSLMREAFRPMFVRPDDETLEVVVDAVTSVNESLHETYFEKTPNLSIDARLPEVGIPALVLTGERDVVVRPENQHDMARKLRLSKEVVYAGEGHMLPNELPAGVAREILSFLEFDARLLEEAGQDHSPASDFG